MNQDSETSLIPLQYIIVVADQIPALQSARQTVESEMQSLVTNGLAESVRYSP